MLPTMMMLWGWLLLHFYPRLGQFAWSAFSDAQGKPGYGRMASMMALQACMLWDTHIVWKTEKIPDLWNQLTFVGGLFFIEKLPEIMAQLRGIPLPAAKIEPVQQSTS